jgi:hypothetical protein
MRRRTRPATLEATMNIRLVARTLSLAATLLAASHAQALTVPLTVFSTGFESGLSSWFDRNPSSPDAAVFDDPLRPGNHVLGFNRTMGSGSVFSNATVSSGGSYTLSFDYLGLPGHGGNAGDLGGYIGVSVGGNGSSQYWVGGTSNNYGTPLNLIDDGLWHNYSYSFNSPIGQPIRVMVEDWDGSGGVAGDAFFDNIVLRDSSMAAPTIPLGEAVPEPSSLALVGLALALSGLGAARRRAG